MLKIAVFGVVFVCIPHVKNNEDLTYSETWPNEFKASCRFLCHKLFRDSRRFGQLHPGPKGPMCDWGPVCVDLLSGKGLELWGNWINWKVGRPLINGTLR